MGMARIHSNNPPLGNRTRLQVAINSIIMIAQTDEQRNTGISFQKKTILFIILTKYMLVPIAICYSKYSILLFPCQEAFTGHKGGASLVRVKHRSSLAVGPCAYTQMSEVQSPPG
jgi:hypothetical protein